MILVAFGLGCLALTGCELDSGGGGRPLGAQVDFNIHMQSLRQNQRWRAMLVEKGHQEFLAQIPNQESGAASINSLLLAAAVDKAVVLSMASAWGAGTMIAPDQVQALMLAENDFVAAECAKFPDRLIPFFSVNPLLAWTQSEIIRCIDELQMQGMTMNFKDSEVSLKNPAHLQKVQAVLAYADVRRLRVILEFGNGHPDFGPADANILIQNILFLHPNLKLQIAHLGSDGGYNDRKAAVFDAFIAAYLDQPAQSRAELFFDMSGVVLTEAKRGTPATDKLLFPRISAQIQAWGADNIRWGSDYWQADSPQAALANFADNIELSSDDYITIVEHNWPWL